MESKNMKTPENPEKLPPKIDRDKWWIFDDFLRSGSVPAAAQGYYKSLEEGSLLEGKLNKNNYWGGTHTTT